MRTIMIIIIAIIIANLNDTQTSTVELKSVGLCWNIDNPTLLF